MKGCCVVIMDRWALFRSSLLAAGVLLNLLFSNAVVAAEAQGAAPPCSGGRTTIELNLAKHAKAQAGELKHTLQAGPAPLNVRIEFTPLANPPTNIGIGRCVEADVARHAIRAAQSHGIGIDRLVFQEILPHRWILFGTTQVAELSWTPVTPVELDQLTDPTLSTDEFQTLYRTLATPKERKRPFGLDPLAPEPTPQGPPR